MTPKSPPNIFNFLAAMAATTMAAVAAGEYVETSRTVTDNGVVVAYNRRAS